MYSAPVHLKGCAKDSTTETWDRMFSPLRLDKDAWWAAVKEAEANPAVRIDGELRRLLSAEQEYWLYCFDAYAY